MQCIFNGRLYLRRVLGKAIDGLTKCDGND